MSCNDEIADFLSVMTSLDLVSLRYAMFRLFNSTWLCSAPLGSAQLGLIFLGSVSQT